MERQGGDENVIAAIFRWLESVSGPFPPEQPDKPPVSFIGFIIHYARPFWPLLLASSTLATVVALIEVYLFSFVGDLVDILTNANPETFWQENSTYLLWMSALVLIAVPLLKFYYEAIIHQGLMGNFAMRIRWEAHRYLLRQSMTFFQDDFAGRIATKMMQTSLAVRDTTMRFTEVFLYVVIYFAGAAVLFAMSDLRLSIPMLMWLVGYIIALWYFIPRLERVSREQADARSVVTGRVVDSYSNISTVKMFAHAEYEDAYAHDGMEMFLDTVYRSMRLSTVLISILYAINGALFFSVAGLGIWLWHGDAITVGAIAVSLGLVLRLQSMSQWVLWEVSRLFEDIGVVHDGIETIARERAVVDAPDAVPLVVNAGAIIYNDISFNYGKERQDVDQGLHQGVIENLSLHIEPTRKIGLVGRSGAGKSTLVSLLLRFYDLEGGTINIDGQDITHVTQESLRARIGMVTQDSSLLHRSIYDNIRYGKPDATLEDVIAAAKKAHAHEFILELEDLWGRTGYDAHVGERGVKLSGGQRQRITIARVLLKDAPILILDEATSALDSEVEAAIQESLFSLMEGKTVIAIAHRLSTIAAMDRLIIMDDGKIIEDGNHETLVEAGGLYAELWARQSGGFLAQSEDEDEAAE
jgi:ATP-binding cassette, subfamily B, multidrug efflux pump